MFFAVFSPVSVLLAAAAAVDVQGSTSCPAPESVSRHLERLLPDAGSAAPGKAHARLAGDGRDIKIKLWQHGDSAVEERRLPRVAACDDLAAAVATIIATWHSDVHPEFAAPALPRRPAPTAILPPVGDLAASSEIPPSPFDVTIALGLAAGAATTPGSPALTAGAELALTVGPEDSRFGARLDFAAWNGPTMMLANDRADVRRLCLGVGPVVRLLSRPGTLHLDLFAMTLLSWTAVQGTGFRTNPSHSEPELGAKAGLLVRPDWRLSPYLALVVEGRPSPIEIIEIQTRESRELPGVTAMISAGLLGDIH